MMATASAPPPLSTTTTASAGPSTSPSAVTAAPSAEETPVSPVAQQTATFQHRTVSAAPVHPFIDTSTPAINSTPVELDGTPTSPEAAEASELSPRSGRRALGRRGSRGPGSEIFNPGVHDEVMEELSGLKGEGSREREKRAALLSSRSKDPAVLVDIPQTPGADELEIAGRVAREGSAPAEEKSA